MPGLVAVGGSESVTELGTVNVPALAGTVQLKDAAREMRPKVADDIPVICTKLFGAAFCQVTVTPWARVTEVSVSRSFQVKGRRDGDGGGEGADGLSAGAVGKSEGVAGAGDEGAGERITKNVGAVEIVYRHQRQGSGGSAYGDGLARHPDTNTGRTAAR